MTNHRFPFEHIVKEEAKEVWVLWAGRSAIAALGLPALASRHFPGYELKLCDKEHLDLLKSELAGDFDPLHP